MWFVTGASKGLSLALVKRLLATGHSVAATRDTAALLDSLQTEPTDNRLALTVDQSVEDAIGQTIDRFGRLDVVVGNAGYRWVGSMEEMTNAEFRQTADVNTRKTANQTLLIRLEALLIAYFAGTGTANGAVRGPTTKSVINLPE